MRTYVAGAGVIAAVLTAAACGTADTSDGSKPSDTGSSARATATPSTGATPTPSVSASRATATTSTEPIDDASVDLCVMADLKLTVTNYDAPGEPVRHLMLVATNKSSKKCAVHSYPEVTLGDAKGFAPVKAGGVDEELTLAPGEKAYAGVLATGGHMDTYTVKFMTVGLGSPGGETEPEKAIRVKMPVTSFEADDGQRVTEWAGTEGLAMRPITQS
ncbi:DUF4232 domain-containing protein [Kribbella jejuensis]|nr:DUF4232 domain-containing protein [Kribbella jejuensis]